MVLVQKGPEGVVVIGWKLEGTNFPSNSTITIARPIESKIKAFGMEFKNAGKSAFSAPFNWAG